MVEKANPSPNRPAEAFATAGAIAYGGSVDGFIVDGTEPTDISIQDVDLNESLYDTFSQSSSTSSLTVSIAGGEAFVFGSWLAIDDTTTVSLDASTTGQTVYIGWNKDSSNDVIIGTDDAFSSAASDTDQRIPLYEFDTDGSGVTNVTDLRQVGKKDVVSALDVAEELQVPAYADTSDATGAEDSIILVDGSGTQTFGLYSYDGSQYVKVGNSDEEIESIIASIITGGSSIETIYDDASDSITINNTGAYFDEDARDAIGEALIGGANISVTDDDPNDEIIINTSALSEEEVQDTVDNLLVGGDNVNLSYDDTGNTLTISVPQAGAFSDTDTDGIGELIDGLSGIQFDDGEIIEFGTGSDVSVRYDSANDELRWQDSQNSNDKMALDRTSGDLRIEGQFIEGQTL